MRHNKKSWTQRLLRSWNRFSDENTLLDFRQKHMSVMKIRIIYFFLVWIVFFLFYSEIWIYRPLIPIIFNLTFLATTICYYLTLRTEEIAPYIVFEVVADVIGHTSIIYVLGLNSAIPALIYGLYISGIGTLVGFNVALLAGALSVFCYLGLLALIHFGIFPDFLYPVDAPGFVNSPMIQKFLPMVFLPVAVLFVLYGMSVMNHFWRQKKKALERRHIQLTALNNIGSTIRRVLSLPNVIHQVIQGVTSGLRFEVCMLVLLDEKNKCYRFYISEENYYARKMQEILGIRFQDIRLPIEKIDNAIYMAIAKNRVIIRNSFKDLMHETHPQVGKHRYTLMQSQIGLKKFVITPMFAEQKGIGVMIGVSRSDFIEDAVIDTLDNFANQAALAIESALLFEEIQTKNRQLIEANRMKSDFLAVMSHELRTPLNAVIGFSEILLDQYIGKLNDEQKNSINEILRNANNLLDLINNILDLAKLESGKMKLSVENFQVTGLMEDILSSLKPLLDKKSQSLVVHFDEHMPEIFADSMKLRQVLVNLLSNAIKFTDENGQIDVTIKYHEPCAELLGDYFHEVQWPPHMMAKPAFYIAVKDNGIGIQPDQKEKIFGQFNQAEGAMTRTHQGTGLGLALSRQLVLLHSGVITVESEPEVGSEFRILLPQMTTQPQRPQLYRAGSDEDTYKGATL